MDDSPALTKQEKLERRRKSAETKLGGRHSSTNLFNEIPFKRPCTNAIDDDGEVIESHDRQRFGILMQFIFPWLPYQCLVRMGMAATYPSFAKTLKTTVRRLEIANDEQFVRRARLAAFKPAGRGKALAARPSLPQFVPVTKPLSVQDFDVVREIVIPFPEKAVKGMVEDMHAMSLVDDHLLGIGAFTTLTHLYVSIQNGAVHYWKSLPTSLVHLCLIHKMGRPFHKLLNLSHLTQLKSLLLHSTTSHPVWPDDGQRMHANCLPPNLISLKTKFSWLAGEIQFLPRTLEILECYSIACSAEDQFPTRLAHIGVCGPVFDNRNLKYFPPSVTSISLVHPSSVKLSEDDQAAIRARTIGWKRGHIDMQPFSFYNLSEVYMQWFTSLTHLDFDAIPFDQRIPFWTAISRINGLTSLSVGIGRDAIGDIIASVQVAESSASVDNIPCEFAKVAPPSLESLQLKIPVAVLLPTERSVGGVLGMFMSTVRFGNSLEKMTLVFVNQRLRPKAVQLFCPSLESFVLPPSLTSVDLVYAMRVPSVLKEAAKYDQSNPRQSMAMLKDRGVQSQLYITLDADVDFSIGNGGAFARPVCDPVLDDFCKGVRQQELTWGWNSSHH